MRWLALRYKIFINPESIMRCVASVLGRTFLKPPLPGPRARDKSRPAFLKSDQMVSKMRKHFEVEFGPLTRTSSGFCQFIDVKEKHQILRLPGHECLIPQVMAKSSATKVLRIEQAIGDWKLSDGGSPNELDIFNFSKIRLGNRCNHPMQHSPGAGKRGFLLKVLLIRVQSISLTPKSRRIYKESPFAQQAWQFGDVQ